ncbi:diacylglycerol/lipid kinase family protein [Calycomorphotria hydatis]|nr:YegS/Rv2252/BmrU family lipid kinase [Calycomorphotria hydatis]
MQTIILNPNAGSMTEERRQLIEERFPDANILESEEKGHTEHLAAEAVRDGAESIIVGGGDGTIGEGINGIAPNFEGITFGILPLGTGNDFARGLKIPLDLASAIDKIEAGNTIPIDLIQLQVDGAPKRYIPNISLGGFDEEATCKLAAHYKNWGPLGYIAVVADGILSTTRYHVELVLPCDTVLSAEVSAIMIANAPYMSGGINIMPGANPADGQFDVILIKAVEATELAMLAPSVAAGTHYETEWVEHIKTTSLTLHSDPAMTFHADGHYQSNTEFSFQIEPSVLNVFASA